MFFEVFAQRAKELRVFGKLLHENLAGAVEHRFDVGKTGVGVDKVLGFGFRAERRVGQQRFGERCQTRFAGNLRLGAALGLVGQVQVFKTLLGLGFADLGGQLRGEFALLINRSEDRGAAVFQLAQVNQPFIEQA